MHTIAAVKLRAPVSSAGRVLLVLAVLAGGASAEPITVYDAFGDGDTFLASPAVGFTEGFQSAFQFVPTRTSRLDRLMVALSRHAIEPAPLVTISVLDSVDGGPGQVLEAFHFAPGAIFGESSASARLSAMSVHHPVLRAHQPFWVAASATGQQGLWHLGFGNATLAALREEEWRVIGLRPPPAVRLMGTVDASAAPVPEPGTMVLFASGCAACLRAARRRKSLD
jgi:hypothetical protein